MKDCNSCAEKCPQAERAHQAALGRMYATNELIELLKKVESGELAPVVHGRWVLIEEGQNTSVYQCSKCKRMVNVVCDKNLREQQLSKNYPYCNCGAKMDRKDDT